MVGQPTALGANFGMGFSNRTSGNLLNCSVQNFTYPLAASRPPVGNNSNPADYSSA
jgi:hypothetical protein